ncbi:MAG: hypothetical protein KJ847_02430, partial [Firmicutes bacterium]|nr:hypothetical protein [Bacillota bacterium]
LDYIKDSDYYKTDGKIDHSKFYGYVSYNITDFDRPTYTEKEGIKKIEQFDNITNTTNYINETYIYNETSYLYEKTEQGVSLNKEIDVLRQAVYELNERIKVLENLK